MRIALVCNLLTPRLLKNKHLEDLAEFDAPETIMAMSAAIKKNGHTPLIMNADENLFQRLKRNRKKIDLVFNVCEGIRGRTREAQVPILLEILNIPYIGSDPLTLAICLNKAYTKDILKSHGVPVAGHQLFKTIKDKPDGKLKFPLIVKLNEEGSKIGLSPSSVVENARQLSQKINFLFKHFSGKVVIVEEYLPGQEFTIGVVGNNPPLIFSPVELKYKSSLRFPVLLFEPDPAFEAAFSLQKSHLVKELKLVDDDYCQAVFPILSKKLAKQLRETALKTFQILGCRDWGRIDLRLDKNGNPHVLEVNPIAGIDPEHLLPQAAKKIGWSYERLIGNIINCAIKRCGIN